MIVSIHWVRFCQPIQLGRGVKFIGQLGSVGSLSRETVWIQAGLAAEHLQSVSAAVD